jgi:hypothetical protein
MEGLTENGRIFLLPPVHDILTLNFEGQVSFRLQMSSLLNAERFHGSNSKQFAREDSHSELLGFSDFSHRPVF